MSHNKTTLQLGSGAAAPGLTICSLALAVRLVAAGALLAVPAAYAQQAAQSGALELDATAITDTVTPADDAVTEGTQSYTTRSARTATPLNMSLRETPQSVSVVTQQRIQDQNLQTITDLVNNAVGVSMNRYETDRGQINARGFELNSLMIDGVPTIWEQPWSSGEIFNSLAVYDRVEVVRGANGLMTGVGDPSASLNMVRKRASSRELTGSVEASAGSWDTYGTKGDLSMPLNESGTVRARLVGELNDGDSWIDKKSTRRETLYGTMDIDLTPDTTLWFGLSHQTTDTKSPMWGGLPVWYADGTRTDWSRSKTSSASWSRWETTYDTYFINLDHTFANDWQVNLSYSRGEKKSESKLLYVSGNPVRGGGTPALSTFPGWYEPETVQDDYSIRFNGPVSLFGREHEVAFGYVNSKQDFDVDYHAPITGFEGITDFDSYSGSFPEPTWSPRSSYGYSDVEQKSYFAATRLNLTDDLKLILGARDTSYEKTADDIFSEVTKIDTSHELTPYAGAVYDLTENVSAYVSYTEIFLPQSVRGTDLKALDPIVGESYETGMKAEFLDGRLNASAAIFQIKQNNLGQSVGPLTGGLPGELGYEGTDVTSKGFELEVSGELADGWNATVGYTQFKVRDAQGDAANTLYPTKLLRTFTTYRLPGVFNKLTIGGGVNWQNDVYTDARNPQNVDERITINSYALVNLMARYDITDNLSAQLNADNVTDEKYLDVFDAFGSMTYGAPRSLTASAKYRF